MTWSSPIDSRPSAYACSVYSWKNTLVYWHADALTCKRPGADHACHNLALILRRYSARPDWLLSCSFGSLVYGSVSSSTWTSGVATATAPHGTGSPLAEPACWDRALHEWRLWPLAAAPVVPWPIPARALSPIFPLFFLSLCIPKCRACILT